MYVSRDRVDGEAVWEGGWDCCYSLLMAGCGRTVASIMKGDWMHVEHSCIYLLSSIPPCTYVLLFDT